ncbi:MAG: trypsin-like peptidase domain-containing protein [Myxococcota bacterium]
MNRADAVLVGIAWFVSLAVAVGLARPREPGLPTVAPIVTRVGPSVVSIEVRGERANDRRSGSGFAIAPAEVATARHLVTDATSVTVQLADGRTWPATVLGTDARTDLALLSVPGADLTPVAIGRGDDVTVGDWVIGLGNALGLGSTPVVGLLAQQGSRLTADASGPRVEFWQLSLALNPGHSGGPVFDQRGRVVAVLSGAHAQGQAVAFAVPIEALSTVVDRLRSGEHISRAFLGVSVRDGGPLGVVVGSVVPSSPADRAGLRPGDVLVALDDTELPRPDVLQTVLDRLSGGVRTEIVWRRSGETRRVPVQLTDWARQPVVVAGMTLGPATGAGARVIALQSSSRADRAGLRVGDVLRAIDGVPMQAPAQIRDRLADGAAAQLQVVRDGRLRRLAIDGRG